MEGQDKKRIFRYDCTKELNEKTVELIVGNNKTKITVLEKDLVMAEIVDGNVKVNKFSF